MVDVAVVKKDYEHRKVHIRMGNTLRWFWLGRRNKLMWGPPNKRSSTANIRDTGALYVPDAIFKEACDLAGGILDDMKKQPRTQKVKGPSRVEPKPNFVRQGRLIFKK